MTVEDPTDALIGRLQVDLLGESRRADLLSKRVEELETALATMRQRAEKAEDALRRRAR
jgi:hypothetical protein